MECIRGWDGMYLCSESDWSCEVRLRGGGAYVGRVGSLGVGGVCGACVCVPVLGVKLVVGGVMGRTWGG